LDLLKSSLAPTQVHIEDRLSSLVQIAGGYFSRALTDKQLRELKTRYRAAVDEIPGDTFEALIAKAGAGCKYGLCRPVQSYCVQSNIVAVIFDD
jgi:hypothetical protein